MKDDGKFFMSCDDFLTGFVGLSVGLYRDDWTITYLPITDVAEGTEYWLDLTVENTEELFIEIDIYTERMFPPTCISANE